MKFFATVEAYKTISRRLVDTQNIISKQIKLLVSDKDYGGGIISWGHISISNPPELYQAGYFKEIRKYSKNKKDLDMRLQINYDSMVKADDKEVYKLVCESILRGVDITENELKIEDFDFDSFRNDLVKLFIKESWISN